MTGAIGLPLATVMEWGRRRAEDKPQQAQGDDVFAQQLAEAVSRSVDRANESGRPVQITVEERQANGGAANNRQFVITVAPAASTVSTAPQPPAVETPRRTAPTSTPMSATTATTTTPPPSPAPPRVTGPPAPDRLPIIPAATSGSVFDLENPIPIVQQRMQEFGYDFSGARFELLDETVSGVGGTIVNHFLRVRTNNGWKEDFAVEYVLRNPSITAHEINGMLRRAPAPPHLVGV